MPFLRPDQAKQLGKAIASTRAALGITCLVAPSLARVWLGPAALTPAAQVLSRSLAARDLALGAGTNQASGSSLRKWLLLSALSDATDMAGTLMTYAQLPKGRRLFVAFASGGAALAGVGAALSLPSAR